MTTIDLRQRDITVRELLNLAVKDPIVIVSEDGHEFILEESDEFEKEVIALSQSEKFIGFLKERAAEPATISIDELEKELALE